jgi:hypothetical protein
MVQIIQGLSKTGMVVSGFQRTWECTQKGSVVDMQVEWAGGRGQEGTPVRTATGSTSFNLAWLSYPGRGWASVSPLESMYTLREMKQESAGYLAWRVVGSN